jgi:hypothetical protein
VGDNVHLPVIGANSLSQYRGVISASPCARRGECHFLRCNIHFRVGRVRAGVNAFFKGDLSQWDLRGRIRGRSSGQDLLYTVAGISVDQCGQKALFSS